MTVKKMINQTIGVSVAGVAISESNKIPQFGGVIGTSIGAGMAVDATKSKKKGGLF